MGKLHSKQVCRREGPEGECILVNTHVDSLSSFYDSYSEMSSSALSGSSCFKGESVPLQVVLPPTREDCETAKLLTMDQKDELGSSTKKLLGSDITTDNNLDKSTTGGISVEEFECGVSVAGSDKQEWSFTLYDFDGRGNITKDDLATLLKSLYDAVGSSIKLPQQGARTMKLRLSVLPDRAKLHATAAAEDPDPAPGSGSEPCKDNRHKDSNNLKHIKNQDNNKLTTKETITQNNLSAAMDKLNVEVMVSPKTPDSAKHHHRQVRNNLSSPRGPGATAPESIPVTMTMTERQQLADLVQQNMERHRRRQHHLRRHNSDAQGTRPSYYHYQHRASATKPHHAPLDATQTKDGQTHLESQERRNYYLDLAGIDSSLTPRYAGAGARHNETAPAALLVSPRAPIRHHASHGTAKYRSKSNAARRANAHHQHSSRSRSHDVMQQQVWTQKDFEVLDPQCEPTCESKVETQVAGAGTKAGDLVAPLHQSDSPPGAAAGATPGVGLNTPARSPEKLPISPLQPKSTSTPKGHKVRPVSLPAHIPETVSPHHHRRHRNRERNKKLAMQQVAEWIEREHSSGTAASWESCGTEHVVVQKHEHHHVHEHHHHHHYHHYQET